MILMCHLISNYKKEKIYLIKIIIHIIKELKNDPLFQLKKIVNRIYFKIRGVGLYFSKFKKRNEIKNFNIVIYTLGKSGSSSVFYTFMKNYPFEKIHHLHFLSDYWIKEVFPNTPHERNIHKAEKYYKYVKKNKWKKTKYIVLVREPISRDISGFFQNYRLMNIDINKNDIESICKQVQDRGHDLALNWFDTDFKKFTDFDIFNYDFNKKLGYSIYKIDSNSEVLIIRTDKLSDVFKISIKEYLNIDFDELYNFNISSNKKDGKLINDFKKKYYESNVDLDKTYNSKFVKHFFTDKEIKKYKLMWSIDGK